MEKLGVFLQLLGYGQRFGILAVALLGFAISSSLSAQQSNDAAEEETRQPISVEELLDLVRNGRVAVAETEQNRISRFENTRNRRDQQLNEARRQRDRALAQTERYESEVNRNTETINDLRKAKDEAYGALREAFANLQASAQENSANFASSVSTGELGYERVEFLSDLAKELENTDKLPDIRKIERMWFELLQEISTQGQIHRFDTEVLSVDGTERTCNVIRIGSYGVICDGKYAVLGANGKFSELGRQPSGIFVDTAEDLQDSRTGEVEAFGIDPTGPLGNTLLKNLIQTPSLEERVRQGGIVGNIIIGLGIFGVIMALIKLVGLTFTGLRISQQIGNTSTPNQDNPLGRILNIYAADPNIDLDSLESRLAEGITAERPKIMRFIGFLKVIATVAPLLGLLGTVTGMIITFQAITLYGTGDPKTMAGGISTALVTTVLGLCVAVPMVLLHSIVQSRADSIMSILERRSLGLVANRAEELGRTLD